MTVGLWVVVLVGCGVEEQQVTTAVAPPPVEVVAAEPAEPRVANMGDPIADGGIKEEPVKWSPVSVPEGPREGGGVRWEGVKRSTEDSLPTAGDLMERFGAENVNPDQEWNRETVQRIIRLNTR